MSLILPKRDLPGFLRPHCKGSFIDQLARLNLALMLTLKGTPFLYNGEEIGMSDLMVPGIELFRDNLGVWIYDEATNNLGVPVEAALNIVQNITRDKCRTPMQWGNAPNYSPGTRALRDFACQTHQVKHHIFSNEEMQNGKT